MVQDNHTHRAYAYRRTGKKYGRLRWSGMGYLGTTIAPEEIALKLKGQPVDAALVRRVLSFATAHLFVEMVPHHGGTGYYCMLPKDVAAPRKAAEPDDPREDDNDDDEDENLEAK